MSNVKCSILTDRVFLKNIEKVKSTVGALVVSLKDQYNCDEFFIEYSSNITEGIVDVIKSNNLKVNLVLYESSSKVIDPTLSRVKEKVDNIIYIVDEFKTGLSINEKLLHLESIEKLLDVSNILICIKTGSDLYNDNIRHIKDLHKHLLYEVSVNSCKFSKVDLR